MVTIMVMTMINADFYASDLSACLPFSCHLGGLSDNVNRSTMNWREKR